MGVMAERLETRLATQANTHDFGCWMASEQKRIFLLCRRMLRDEEDADAATQDTFLKAWQALSRNEAVSVDDSGKWLTRIAVNTCLDRLRSKRWQFWRKRPNQEDESMILQMKAASGPSAEERILAGEIEQRLTLALEKLSLRQRSVFTLRHYEGLSLQEIGEALDLDTGTVKAHLFRALEKLRTELKDLYFREGKNNEALERK
jgi:RNA polymerase sigma-70 factor (ECF subfamily)